MLLEVVLEAPEQHRGREIDCEGEVVRDLDTQQQPKMHGARSTWAAADHDEILPL